MEGLSNPNKLEALWEQSKAKKLWDELQDKSSARLDRYLSEIHAAKDSVPIEDYMNRWCNVIQTPNSPTPQENHRIPQLFSPEERVNLDNYNKFINKLSVRIEGGWSPTDTIPYDEDLLRYTLRLSPRVKSNKEFYLDSDRITKQSISDRNMEFDKESTSAATTKRELQPSNQREKRQFSEYEELPFQQGLPLKEDNNKSKIPDHDREIFMAILSNPTNRKVNPMALEDLDYDDFFLKQR
jgi:hypothetical protein